MSCTHIWGKWIKGRRTGYSFRACARCGAIDKMPPPEREEDQPELSIRGRMSRFHPAAIGFQDWRKKGAGES